MFEGIFNEGDEDERSYFGTVSRTDVEVSFHCNVGGQADAHQGNVVADKVHFFVEWHYVLLVVVENMAEQATQFLYGLLCFVGIEGNKSINIIQGVEQEVWIELATQVLEFGFRALLFGFAACSLVSSPTAAHADGSTKPHSEYHGEYISKEKNPFGRSVRTFHGTD